jgi:hypothetical protein
LNANDTIADLIQPNYLDYLCTVLKGKLKITYILSKPPPIWRGLAGRIDDTLLFDWIYQNYSVPPPAIPPRLSANYSIPSGSGSGSNTNSMASSNTVTNFNPLGSRSKSYGKSPMHDFEEFEEIVEQYNSDPHRQSQQSQLIPPRQQQHRRYDDDEDHYDPQYRASINRMPPPSPIQIPVQKQISPPDGQYSPNSQNLPYYFSPLHNINPHHSNEIMLLNERHNYMKLLAMDNSNQIKLVVCGHSYFNDSIRKSLEKLGFPIDEKALFIV